MHFQDPRIIDAEPTKTLFIDMLTRDISLLAALIDLVDNTADGAQRLRNDARYDGLWARLNVQPDRFRISDNCGGIPVDIARRYAFRFGRPEDAPTLKHSIGQFGVGMKRAIFKLGRRFMIESATATERFLVREHVEEWAVKPEWTFTFAELEEGLNLPDDRQGTTVIVEELHSDVAASFEQDIFLRQLQVELRKRLREAISKGLAISLNGIPVDADPLTLLSEERLTPAFRNKILEPEPGNQVQLKVYCGLGPSEDAAAAGWHVYCNGRLVLEADKTPITGWGTQDGMRIPGFHPQYNHFRGYVYFDADDAALLPWNTTKTSVNADSPVYRSARVEMRSLMRPVIDFLNVLAAEKKLKEGEEDRDPGPLESLVASSPATPVAETRTRDVFEVPKVEKPTPKPSVANINYKKPRTQVREIQRLMKARTYREVGEGTFDYFYRAEVEGNE